MSITYTPNTYAPNNLIRITAAFFNSSGALADPTTVVLWVNGPDASVLQLAPIRDSQGLYHYDYTTSTPGGKWYYRYQGMGAIVAQSPDTVFNVLFPQF